MSKQNHSAQSGVAHLVLVIVIIVVLAIGFVGWRVFNSNKQEPTKTSSQNTSNSTNEPDIELQNVGLASLDSVLVTKDALREYDSKGLKGFYAFGDKLGGKTDTRLNPNFEFASLKDGTKVVSAIDGVVGFVKQQPDSGDYEVFIQPKDNSIWTIGYDHIKNVAVQKGASIKAGDVIGEPAAQGNGALRFEIQINKDKEGVTTHYCPSSLLAQSVKSKILKELSDMQVSWESTTGYELYDIAAQQPTGCVKQTMTAQEAEGM